MGNIFGRRTKAPLVTAQDRAILRLKQTRDKIKIYQKKIGANLEGSMEMAAKLMESGHKERALIVLRRKKCIEETLLKTDQQLETLEQLVSDIEYTQIEVSVVEGLKVGSEALKQLNDLMNIDDIQKMMEDNEEAADKQREISDILAKSAVRFDEEELLKELDALKGIENLPNVPEGFIEVDNPQVEPVEIEKEQEVQVKAEKVEEKQLEMAT